MENLGSILTGVALVITALGGIVIGGLQLLVKRTVDQTHTMVNGRWSEMATMLVHSQERAQMAEARLDELVKQMQKSNEILAEAAAGALLRKEERNANVGRKEVTHGS